MDLSNLSADQLESLSLQAAELAADLRKVEPTYELALANGVVDQGYRTVRYGWVASYGGEAEITMADGRRWRAIGRRSSGPAEGPVRQGRIEFALLAPTAQPDAVAEPAGVTAWSSGSTVE